MGDLDGALKDYTDAIRLDPDDVQNWLKRGNIWRAKGEMDKAIADYSQAIKIASFYLKAYEARGVAYLLRGDFAGAQADLLSANRRPSSDVSLLLFIARSGGGQDAGHELQANYDRITRRDWPSQMIEFYLGRRSLRDVLKEMARGAKICFIQKTTTTRS